MQIAQLGINPTHSAMDRVHLHCWLWGIVILFVPAGQFIAMLWLFSARRKANARQKRIRKISPTPPSTLAGAFVCFKPAD